MDSEYNGIRPAHPLTLKDFRDTDDHPAPGLTKREYFAGRALQGILSNSNTHVEDPVIAALAVKIADELLVALEKE